LSVEILSLFAHALILPQTERRLCGSSHPAAQLNTYTPMFIYALLLNTKRTHTPRDVSSIACSKQLLTPRASVQKDAESEKTQAPITQRPSSIAKTSQVREGRKGN
jgi:hypothetical protein